MNDETTTSTTSGHAYFVDEDTCIGCALCTTVCPHGYAMMDSGKSQTTITDPTDDPLMEEALIICPVGAIKHRA